MHYTMFVYAVLTALVLSSSCALPVGTESVEQPQSYSMNGVKLITDAIARGDDPSTFGQNDYTVGPGRRLLMRFEELGSHLDEVRLDGSKKVEVLIATLDAASATAAKDHARLCPLTRDWMMLSTWTLAHPFGTNGDWTRPGGDYDQAGCVAAHQVDGQKLYFDMTTWFVDYPRGRKSNYGLILMADTASVTITGENSGSYSPRILWTR